MSDSADGVAVPSYMLHRSVLHDFLEASSVTSHHSLEGKSYCDGIHGLNILPEDATIPSLAIASKEITSSCFLSSVQP